MPEKPRGPLRPGHEWAWQTPTGFARRFLGIARPSGFLTPAATTASAYPAGAGTGGGPRTLHVVGDVTVATAPATVIPRAGWGQALSLFLRPDQFVVRNRALASASARTFVETGLMDRVLAPLRPGDYLLISFGHNDQRPDARHSLPFTSYQRYLARCVDTARSHGAWPVFVTSVERRRFDRAGHACRSHGAYPAAMRALGQRLSVPVVDLTTLTRDLWERLGTEGTKRYFLWLDTGEHANFPAGAADNTHLRAHGAIEVARMVVQELTRQHLVARDQVERLDGPVPDGMLVWPAQRDQP